MDFKVLIADSAIADLKEIVEFVAEDNSDAAIRLGKRLLAHALSLATMPQRFPFHDKRRGIRKMPLPPFLIFYVRDETASVVSILHFWDGARRSPGLPRVGAGSRAFVFPASYAAYETRSSVVGRAAARDRPAACAARN